MQAAGGPAGPWLTVIMPAYRGERWIDAALGSIAREPAAGIEVLLIDSSPTSATRDVAQRYGDRLQLRILERADLDSWPHKTNVGVQLAKAAHVCWLHVDDLWLPGRAAAVRSWLDAAPLAALHLAPSAIIDSRGRQLGVWRCPLPADRPLAPDEVTARLLVQNFIAAPAPVFRRDAWLRSGGLDESLWYTGDWDIWLKLAARGTVIYHTPATTAFRIHAQSLTVTGSHDLADIEQQLRAVLARHLPRSAALPPSTARAAEASVRVNLALAAAADRDYSRLLPAARAILALGPAGARRYLRDSRLLERLLPRLRARLAGAF